MREASSVTSATALFLATPRAAPPPATAEHAPFVGRRAELARLGAALADAAAGHGTLAAHAGEAGIGKTRTAEELAREARRRGHHVLFGACSERDDAPAFSPWAEAILTWVERRDPVVLRAELGPGAGDVAQIVPAIHKRLPNLPPSPNLASEQARQRLFESVTTFLKRAAGNRPLLLVLDDLHAADRASLRLLEVLAHELRDARILVLVTYRDNEIEQRYPVGETLAEAGRHTPVVRMALPPLTEEDVARFLALRTGTAPRADVVAALHRRTEGNPLSMTESVHLALAEGSFTVPARTIHRIVPERVQAVIGRRLDRLSPACRELLTVAALLGREFDARVLARAFAVDVDTALALLDEAATARIVAPVPDTVGRYRFTHALVAGTLEEPLAPSQRIELHRRIGEALEVVHVTSLDQHAAEIAHHYFHCAVNGGAPRAIAYALRAADVRPPAAGRYLLRREGDSWAVRGRGEVFRLKDGFGLRCLALLIRRANVDVGALELASLARGRAADVRDAVRRTRRGAPAGALAERARINVTRTIRDAIRRIGEHDPALAHHLTASVRTGATCRYAAAPAATAAWEL